MPAWPGRAARRRAAGSYRLPSGRRARDHLRILAAAAACPAAGRTRFSTRLTWPRRDRRVREFSLGMRQRLGIAAALLGDPQVLLLDEPANGLDPAGIAWLRGLLRGFAGEGRTVVVASHVLSEVAQTADHVVIVSDGRLRFAGPLARSAGRQRAGVGIPET